MIKRRTSKASTDVKVSFVLDNSDPRLPASVVGDFNGWVPGADPLVKRNNGTASAVVVLRKGDAYRFRYRSIDGRWFNDDEADGYETNVHGSTDCVVVV